MNMYALSIGMGWNG